MNLEPPKVQSSLDVASRRLRLGATYAIRVLVIGSLCLGTWVLSRTTAAATPTPLGLRYVHDADGQRVARIQIAEDAATGERRTNIVRYLYDTQAMGGYSQRLVELENGKPVRLFVRGVGPVAEWKRPSDTRGTSAASASFHLADGHGSTRLQISQTGAVSSRKDYDAFGASLAPSELATDGCGYTGEFWDSSLQQLDLRARTYDPSVGRFPTADSYEGMVSSPGSLNKFVYAYSNPVGSIDPSGHFALSDLSYAIGARMFVAGSQLAAYPQAIGLAKVTMTALTVGSLMVSDEARIAYLATGNPAAAAASLAEDVGIVLYRGGSALQQVGSSIARSGVINKLEQPMASAARQIRSLSSDAMIGFRGSLATGVKFRSRGPFDPLDFDLDAFIVSDRLARQIPGLGRFKNGRLLPEIAEEADKVDRLLRASFSGYRTDKPFTFRIWTTEEYERIVTQGAHGSY